MSRFIDEYYAEFSNDEERIKELLFRVKELDEALNTAVWLTDSLNDKVEKICALNNLETDKTPEGQPGLPVGY